MLKKFFVLKNLMRCCILSKSEIEENKLEGYYIIAYNEEFSKGEWGNYKAGKREGVAVNWDKNFGMSKGNYISGELEGTVEYRYIDGNKEYCEVKKGIKNGESTFIWKDGGSEVREYKDNLKNGKAIRYFNNGAIEKLNYIDGKIEGKVIYEFPNGNKIEKNYKNNEIIGDRILIFSNGIKKILTEKEMMTLEKGNLEIEICFKLFTEILFRIVNELENKIKLYNKQIKEKESIEEEVRNNIKDIYGRKQGRWIIKEITGERTEGNFIDNEKDGEWITYKNKNYILIREFYKNGKLLEYENKIENKNGLLKWQLDEKEQKQGEWILREVNEEGILKSFEYKDNNLNGEYKSFYRNGNKCEKGNYINNKFEGKYIKYFENGQVKEEGRFINGKKDGKWNQKYSNLELGKGIVNYQIIANYKLGILNGKYIKYKNEKLIEEGEYKKGYKIGKWLETDEEDNSFRGEYINDKREGKWLKFGNEEKIELNYQKGLLVGEYVLYYKNGNVKKELYYTSEGKILFEREYYNDGKIKSIVRKIYQNNEYLQDGLRLEFNKGIYKVMECTKDNKNKTIRKYESLKDVLEKENKLLEFLKIDKLFG